MSNIWFFADLHLGHKNIVLGETSWGPEKKHICRNFKTLKEHDSTIINNLNKYIKKNDVAYCIGDFSLGGRENVKKYRNLINCNNIHICVGNHDNYIKENCVFEDGTTAYELFSSVQECIYKKISNTFFVMCHYAYRKWPNGANGSINLHGDSHGNLPEYQKLLQIADDPVLIKTGDLYKQIDVGIDVAKMLFGEYRPFHINEIKEIMKNRINLDIDFN